MPFAPTLGPLIVPKCSEGTTAQGPWVHKIVYVPQSRYLTYSYYIQHSYVITLIFLQCKITSQEMDGKCKFNVFCSFMSHIFDLQ